MIIWILLSDLWTTKIYVHSPVSVMNRSQIWTIFMIKHLVIVKKTEMERLSEQSLSIAKLSSTWVGVFIRGVSIILPFHYCIWQLGSPHVHSKTLHPFCRLETPVLQVSLDYFRWNCYKWENWEMKEIALACSERLLVCTLCIVALLRYGLRLFRNAQYTL